VSISSSNGTGSTKTAYIPVRHRYIGAEQMAPELVAEKLKPLLEDKKVGKVAQNAKFEMNVLSLIGIELTPVLSDPMLASYIRNPDDKHGLKEQAERIFNYYMTRITDIIGTGKKQIDMGLAPILKVAPYAADDARLTLELARYYASVFDEEQRYLLHQMELP